MHRVAIVSADKGGQTGQGKSKRKRWSHEVHRARDKDHVHMQMTTGLLFVCSVCFGSKAF